jgi:osmoprotectant transport system ATP-binding protein
MESGKLVQYDTPETILSKPVNKFVHDFVGTDRALKRLSRIGIAAFLRPSPAVTVNTPVKEAQATIGSHYSAWVIDEEGRPVGWIDRASLFQETSVKEAMVAHNTEEIALMSKATLREALSRMLGQGFKSIPVVDDKMRLIGEITLSDVEAATAKAEA